MKIAVDFDGTIVEDAYPSIGKEKPFAITALKSLQQHRHKLILWTVREGELLDEAVQWCKERGLEFYAVNRDYPEEEIAHNAHFSRKLKVDLFIDDRNLGGIPDWGGICQMVNHRLSAEAFYTGDFQDDDQTRERHAHRSEHRSEHRSGKKGLFSMFKK